MARNFACCPRRWTRASGPWKKARHAEPIGITGAPGCGVTTLGRALAARIGAVLIDTDDHYWVATDPPYREKRGIPERLARMRAEQALSGRWVVSGTLHGWAEGVVAEAELIVFLEAPTELRLERLRAREQARFGNSLLPAGRCTTSTANSSNGPPIMRTAPSPAAAGPATSAG